MSPRRSRLLSWATLCWIVRHRAWSVHHLRCYARLAKVRITRPHIVFGGLVFLGRGVELEAREGYGRLEIGAFTHIGDRTRIRCHEGSLRIGEKAVLGCDNTINVYLDVEIGASALFADSIYVCDFDHRFADIHTPIKDQGIVKSPVRIGPDTWLGTKVTVLRGSRIGRGAVLGAHTVVRGDTISGIAARHGLRTADVLAWNDLGWKSIIHPGDVIKGDADGVVVVRRDEVEAAIALSAARDANEARPT